MIEKTRVATLDDIEDIVRIYNDAIKSRIATADTEPITIGARKEEFKRQKLKQYPIWVREHHGKVIAFLNFKPFNERSGYFQSAEISIYLDRNFQGQKLGQQMLKEALAEAPKLGFKNLLALIFSDNDPSVKLFKKFGFKEWGKLPKVARIDDKDKDLLILGYFLG